MMFFIHYLLSGLVAYLFPKLFSKLDKNFQFNAKINQLPFINIIALFTIMVYRREVSPLSVLIMYSIAIEYSAALMDFKYKSVYDIIHISSLLFLIPIFILYHKWPIEAFVVVGISLLLSFGYGLSDALAFSLMGFIIEAWFLCLNLKITMYSAIMPTLIAMASTCIIFTVVQILKKNLKLNGKTKVKTAFIPYIFIVTCLAPILFILR